jgi:hypothetical protein
MLQGLNNHQPPIILTCYLATWRWMLMCKRQQLRCIHKSSNLNVLIEMKSTLFTGRVRSSFSSLNWQFSIWCMDDEQLKPCITYSYKFRWRQGCLYKASKGHFLCHGYIVNTLSLTNCMSCSSALKILLCTSTFFIIEQSFKCLSW